MALNQEQKLGQPQKPNENKTTIDDKTLDSKIIEYINKNPGVHFNDLLRALNLAAGTLQYHLNKMEQQKQIIVIRKEYKTLYFPPSLRDPQDQKIMILLRQKIPRNLLLILLEHKEKSGHELTKLLSITKSTLSYYTKRLEELGILKTAIEGREKRFSVAQPEKVAQLLSEHKKSFSDELVDRFVDLWVRI